MSKSLEMVKLAKTALEDKKAGDIKVIDISGVSVLADYTGSLKGTANGVAGGLLAAGTAQSLSLTEKVTTGAALTNSTVNASETLSVIAQDTHTIRGTASGYSGAGFVSGGLTVRSRFPAPRNESPHRWAP